MRVVLGVALATALVALGALVGTSLGDRQSRPGTAASRIVAMASASPTAAVTAAAPSRSAPSAEIAGIELRPLDMQGDVVFAARIVEGGGAWGTHELWAISLSDGARARTILRYPRSPFTDAWPARYLSPDGRRYAFEADRGDGIHRIVIADLLTGDLKWLRTDDSVMHDRQPVWDPTGSVIAFSRASGDVGRAPDEGVWVVKADGSELRQLVEGGRGPTYIYHWTPDGRGVAVAQGIGYDVIDVQSGERQAMDKVVSGDASWRAAAPQLVARGWETTAEGDVQYIFTATAADAPRQFLVRGTSVSEFLVNPRWRPGADEILYVRSLFGAKELRVRSLSGAERTLSTRPMFAPAWSRDGSAVVYIHAEMVAGPSPMPCPTPREGIPCPLGRGGELVTTELRIVSADGTSDRSLFRLPSAGAAHTPGWCVCVDGLATRRY